MFHGIRKTETGEENEKRQPREIQICLYDKDSFGH
jgi:hypothetical protein